SIGCSVWPPPVRIQATPEDGAGSVTAAVMAARRLGKLRGRSHAPGPLGCTCAGQYCSCAGASNSQASMGISVGISTGTPHLRGSKAPRADLVPRAGLTFPRRRSLGEGGRFRRAGELAARKRTRFPMVGLVEIFRGFRLHALARCVEVG